MASLAQKTDTQGISRFFLCVRERVFLVARVLLLEFILFPFREANQDPSEKRYTLKGGRNS